jgi:transposase-like protein
LDRGGKLEAGVRRVDAAGRRWYTREFKGEIVAQCAQQGASVSRIAVDHGLNPNLVRKWIERGRDVGAVRVAARFVPVKPLPAIEQASAARTGESIQIRIGTAVISIGEAANPALVCAIVQALR